jgi:hypothetical protein
LASNTYLGSMTRYLYCCILLFDKWSFFLSWARWLMGVWACNIHVAFRIVLRLASREILAFVYCFVWDSANLEGQESILISPRYRVAQLYPRAICFPFVAP